MSGASDLESLARRYIELWEEQLSQMAADPDAATALGQMLTAAGWAGNPTVNPTMWAAAIAQAMQQTPFGGAAGRGGAGAFDTARASGTAGIQPHGTALHGAEAAAAAPDDSGGDLRQFERRLAALEERLAAVESALAGKGGGARRGSRERRT